jgi:hypothetical protein
MTGSRFRSGMSRPTRLPLPHPIGKRCEKERSKSRQIHAGRVKTAEYALGRSTGRIKAPLHH